MTAFSEIAAADLAESGTFDDYRIPADTLGGFKPAQVMFHALKCIAILTAFLTYCFLSTDVSMARWQTGFSRNIGSVDTRSDVAVSSASA